MRETEEKEAAHAAALETAKSPEGETLAEKLAREKEERKQAALERSKKRQEEKAYFEERKKANEAGLVKKEADAAAKRAALAAIGFDKAAVSDGTGCEVPAEADESKPPGDVLPPPPLLPVAVMEVTPSP